MNYRHIYHAGNFAEVIKHITLMMLIQKLKEKDKPFAILDAFAGIGLYDLRSEEAQKTLESERGIGSLRSELSSPPSIITEYLRLIDSHTELYPGSPTITAHMLREADQLIAAELHPADYIKLKHNMRHSQNVHVHHIDAYNAIKAFCPPKEKRGLVLLDPAFEVRDEFDKILEALKLIKKRFAGGMVMIWYPIKEQSLVSKFYQRYKEVGYAESLTLEFEIGGMEGMNKCGIIISQPPHIEADLRDVMNYLAKALGGTYTISLLK